MDKKANEETVEGTPEGLREIFIPGTPKRVRVYQTQGAPAPLLPGQRRRSDGSVYRKK